MVTLEVPKTSDRRRMVQSEVIGSCHAVKRSNYEYYQTLTSIELDDEEDVIELDDEGAVDPFLFEVSREKR